MTRRIADLPPCAKCEGPLVPLLACNTCGYVSVLRTATEVDRFLACPECTATNEVQFLCDECHARFVFEAVPDSSQRLRACPACATFLGPDDKECPTCGKKFGAEPTPPTPEKSRRKRRIKGQRDDRRAQEIRKLPGIRELQARALLHQGYDAIWKLQRASQEELARIPELGRAGAQTIKESLRSVMHATEYRPREVVLDEEFECPLCGCVTSAFSSTCLECGATFDEEEMDEDVRRSLVQDGEQGLLAFYDLHLHDDPDDAELWYARGLLLEAMGEDQEAMRSFDRAASLSSNKKIAVARTRLLSKASQEPGVPDRLRSMLRDIVDETGLDEEMKALQRSLADRGPACPVCDEPLPPNAQVCPACSTVVGKAPIEEAPKAAKHSETEILDSLMDDLSRPAPQVEPEPTTPASLETMAEKFEESLSPEDVERTRLATLDWLMEELEESIIGGEEEVSRPPVTPREVSPRPSAPPRGHVATKAGFLSKSLLRRQGLVNGRGAINGSGRVNGYINGAGKVNGFINGRGRVNGFINGRGRVNGFINGRGYVNGAALMMVRLPAKSRRPAYASLGAGILVALVVLIALLPPPSGPAPPIAIDGSFADWASVPMFDAATSARNANVEIARYAHFVDRDNLYLFAKTKGTTFGDNLGYDGIFFLIDADGNPATGFTFAGLGAEFVVEVDGGNASVASASLYSFPADAELNWSRRQAATGVSAAASPAGLEVQVSMFSLDPFDGNAFRVAVYADDFEGASSRSEALLSRAQGAILVRSRPLTTVVGSTATDLLEIQVRALGLVAAGDTWTVSSFQFNATAGLIASLSAESVNLTRDLPSATIRVSAQAPGFLPGDVVSVELRSVVASRQAFLVGESARAYVGSPYVSKRVDGLFDDWFVDSSADTDASRVNNSNVDIVRSGGAPSAATAFFEMEVSGRIFDGSLPQRVVRIPRPGGGGGGGGGPGGPPARLTGEDISRVYIDANASDSAGTPFAGILADYMVEVRGVDGRITQYAAFRWQSRWVPVPTLTVEVAKNSTALEGSLDLSLVELNGTATVFATTDWSGDGDFAEPPVVGSFTLTAKATSFFLQPLHSSSSQLAVASSLTTGGATIDGNCATTGAEYSGAGTFSSTGLDGKVGKDGFYVYICIDVTGDTDNEGAADSSAVYFDTDHSGATAPETNDRKFRVTSGSPSIESSKGTGSAWASCSDPDCDSGNDAEGAWQSGHQVYEFKIRFANVWGTDTPSANRRAGFAVIASDSGASPITWGSTDPPSDANPSTWGHLDIPEFQELLVPVAGILVLAFLFHRRRQVT